jgi:zinc transporter ZupT
VHISLFAFLFVYIFSWYCHCLLGLKYIYFNWHSMKWVINSFCAWSYGCVIFITFLEYGVTAWYFSTCMLYVLETRPIKLSSCMFVQVCMFLLVQMLLRRLWFM